MSPYFTRLIPASIRRRVAESRFYNRRMSKELARSSKRLDLCAAQIAHVLHLSGAPSVQGKVCLEIGSGWVLSHAVILHLLGAKRVIATDVSPLAQPASLSVAIHKAVPYIVRDILSPFCEHSEIRARLDNLLSINKFTFDVLNRLGIEYIAPIDLARERLNVPLDFIYSGSVLEYIPANDIPSLLENLTRDLRKGGMMIHCIHIEDPGKGVNRINSGRWREFFGNVKDLECRFIYQWSRTDQGEDDFSHIGVMGIKK